MALLKKTQRSFAGGMLDKDLTGRQDLKKYAEGCLVLENFKVRKQGNIIKRSGTDLICDFSRCLGNGATDVVSTAKLVPLIQERESGYYILMTGKKAFVVSPSGMKMSDGTWSRAPFHATQGTGGQDPVVPYSIAIPFDDSDLEMIDWCQSGDTIFFAHRSYAPCKIVYANGALTYTKLEFRQGLGNPPTISNVEVLGTDGKWYWNDDQSTTWTASGESDELELVFTATISSTEYSVGASRADTSSDWAVTTTMPSGRTMSGQPTYSGKSIWTGTGGEVHVEYAVTAVKDGVETGMSVPFAIEYNAPWPTGGSIKITIDTSGMDPDSWDCFYIYKKESDVFGLIGTTSNQTAFVSISNGFAVDGTLYPSGFTTFDKNVHLRESGNKFASVYETSGRYVERETSLVQRLDSWRDMTGPSTNITNEQWIINQWVNSHTHSEQVVADEDTGTVRSSTAQKECASSVVFSVGEGHEFDTFNVRIGSVLHKLSKQVTLRNVFRYKYAPAVGYYIGNTEPDVISSNTTTQWTGTYSEFSACPAKWFKATVEYLNDGGTWTTSEAFDCSAAVDQTNPGQGWEAVAGASNKWRKTYTNADAMWSYTDAATVLARMDANQPSVGATVDFTVPAEAIGKRIRKITVYGFESNASGAAAAGLIVNGIACYQSGTYVNTFTDSYITPDLTITPPKTEDHFVNPSDYPGCVQIYSQRLVYAASASNPFTVWMSCTGDLTNFDAHEYVRASDAITASTAALEMPRINRMLVHRDLMLFAEGGEWQVAPSSGNAIAPSTVAAKLQSAIGCASWIKPIAIDSDILFCDSSGETLMATRYNFASDGYDSSNLSVLSQRLFRNNAICSMAYVQFPESTIECVLSDGTIASLVYMKEHEVCAWSKHVLGGSWKAVNVAANKSVSGGSSHCAFVATRSYDVTNGNTTSTVREWAVLGLRDIDPNDSTLLGNLRMDAVRTETVARVANTALGEVPQTDPVPPTPGHGETVVKIGEVRETISGATYITGDRYAIGCAFASIVKTTSPEFTDQETAQMEIKNATESEVRVIDGSDFTVRQPEVDIGKATQMKVANSVDTSSVNYTVSLSDADCRMPLTGTNTRNGSVVLEHSGHLPLAVLSVTTSFRVEYANHANGGSNDGRG